MKENEIAVSSNLCVWNRAWFGTMLTCTITHSRHIFVLSIHFRGTVCQRFLCQLCTVPGLHNVSYTIPLVLPCKYAMI